MSIRDKRPPRMGDAMALVSRKLGEETARMLAVNGDELFADQELNSSDPHMPKKLLGMWM